VITSDILSHFLNINTWKSKGTRAPHKPLLLLIALGEIQRGNTGFIPYKNIEFKLKDLLIDFGPYRKNYYPNLPFTKLPNDKLWQLNKPTLIDTKIDYSSKFLREHHLAGKFPDEVTQQLIQNPELIRCLTESILEQNFPDTLHEDILNAVGIDLTKTTSISFLKQMRKRDPLFRDSILKAYEYECAVCGFSVRLRHQLLAIEAAHIKWHQAGGPDIEVNGLALCATHHKLFDMGAFTVTPELKMMVSDEVNGTGAQEWLVRYDGKSIKPPQKTAFYPNPEYTNWHVNEVFKGGYREVLSA
jgi:putative restriction endonuclease